MAYHWPFLGNLCLTCRPFSRPFALEKGGKPGRAQSREGTSLLRYAPCPSPIAVSAALDCSSKVRGHAQKNAGSRSRGLDRATVLSAAGTLAAPLDNLLNASQA